MSTPRQGGALGDELANLGIIALIAAAALAVILRVAGTIAAWATGIAQPSGGIEAGLRVLLHLANPGTALGSDDLNAVVYWIVAGLLILGVGAAGWWVWRTFREHTRRTKIDPYRIVGIATRTDVATAASERALLRRGGQLRPSLPKPEAQDVGYLLGAREA